MRGRTEQTGDGVETRGVERVLISGASFAGLATAWWMRRLGYAVTVVEMAPGLRKGGTPVDIREGVVEVVRRMGLLERIAAQSLPKRSMEFLDGAGERVVLRAAEEDPKGEQEEYEIERDALLDLLFAEVEDGVEWLFGESIAGLEQTADEVRVTLRSGGQRTVAYVFGCDGTHSAVRRMCFGEEREFLLFLRNYFSLTIVDRLLIEENTSQMLNVPGKTVMLNAYHGKTDVAFCFATDETISYDRRDRAEQRRMIREHFAGEGWRVPELLGVMDEGEDFYFDQLCQIRMPRWTEGRVALVGDAGYCPSPAAGMGGSMAILGAAALGEAFERHRGDYREAFREYDRSLRPVVEGIQQEAVEVGMEMFLPRSTAALERRNSSLRMGREA